MPHESDSLKFYANLLREEIKAADAKVSAAIASSSIILSANFLMLRAATVSPAASATILLASASALLAVIFAIRAIMPKRGKPSDALFFFRNTAVTNPADLLHRLGDTEEVNRELSTLCHDLARIVERKYALVTVSLTFLVVSASATSLAVLIRFLGEETYQFESSPILG